MLTCKLGIARKTNCKFVRYNIITFLICLFCGGNRLPPQMYSKPIKYLYFLKIFKKTPPSYFNIRVDSEVIQYLSYQNT